MSETIAAWQDNILCPFDKLEVHKRGLKHPAVSVFIKRENDILLQKRAATKYHSPNLWANTVFTNPRVLHFHTCGDYSPGEICWMIIDPTVSIDNKNLWEQGRLRVNDFVTTRACLKKWRELIPLFDNPSLQIGI